MKIAPFLLCAQISCALVAALDGILSEGVKVSELFDRSQLAAENGYQVGHGQKGLPKRLWRREDQQSQVEKRSIETEQEDALTEGTKDKWTSFSEGFNTKERWVEVEKRSGGVFKRDQSQAVFPVDVGGYKVEENVVLGFILGDKKLDDSNCKTNLETYCNGLKKDNKELIEKDPFLNHICDKFSGKCQDLENKVKEKAKALKEELEKKISALDDVKKCSGYEVQCFLLEKADPTQLKENCNALRKTCYGMKRSNVTYEFLLRVLKGHLDGGQCINKLKEVCLLVAGESDDLMKTCLEEQISSGGGLCTTGLPQSSEGKCQPLKIEVEKALNESNTLGNHCPSLLEECYFYGEECTKNIPKCNELKKECNKHNHRYTPPGLFNPIEQEASLQVTGDLSKLYLEAALEGVVIGRPNQKDDVDLLALLALSTQTGSTTKDKCEASLKSYCKNMKEKGILGSMCKNDGNMNQKGTGNCKELDQKIQKKCTKFKKELENNNFCDDENCSKKEISEWNKLPDYLRDEDCVELESGCFYLENYCDLKEPCQNVRAACYKKGLKEAAITLLEKGLKGKINPGPKDDYKDCQKALLEKCKSMKNVSAEVFEMCLHPENTCQDLFIDINDKFHELKIVLHESRDHPTKQDCVVLPKKCEALETDKYSIKRPCDVLRRNCHFHELLETLKDDFLDKGGDMLKGKDTCQKSLGAKCDMWGRRKEKRFSLPCAMVDRSCELITDSVEEHCDLFHDNLDKKKEELAPGKLSEDKCLLWVPYCKKLKLNCDDEIAKNITDRCNKLEENCKLILEMRRLKDLLKHELKGNLKEGNEKDKCVKELSRLCQYKGDANKTALGKLCGNEKDTNDDTNQKLCKKLIDQVQWECPQLKVKLNEAKDEMKNKSKEYKEKREAVEKTIKEKEFFLVFKSDEDKKQINLIRRAEKKSSEKAPTVVSKATSDGKEITGKQETLIEQILEVSYMYSDLKQRCKELTSDCDFKKDCDGCESACNSILAICGEVKPLMLKEPPVIEKECKEKPSPGGKPSESAAGEKEKPGTPKPSKPEGQAAGQEKKCDPVKTVDKWTTTTSTYTTTTTSTKTTTLKVTLTSTRKCKPTKCTTGKGEPTSKGEEEEVIPSGGRRWLPSVGIVIVGVVVAIM